MVVVVRVLRRRSEGAGMSVTLSIRVSRDLG